MDYFVQVALAVIAGLFAVITLLLGWWIKSAEENSRLRIENVNVRLSSHASRMDDHGAQIGKLFSATNDLEVKLSADHYNKQEIRDAISTVASNAVSILSAQMSGIQRQIDDLRRDVSANRE